MNGILTLYQGQPLRFTVAQNTSNSFGGGQTPNTTGVSANLGSGRIIDRWFDPSQFSQPAVYTFGNMARSTAQLPNANARLLDLQELPDYGTNEGGIERGSV